MRRCRGRRRFSRGARAPSHDGPTWTPRRYFAFHSYFVSSSLWFATSICNGAISRPIPPWAKGTPRTADRTADLSDQERCTEPKTQPIEAMVCQAAKEQSRSRWTPRSKPSIPHGGEHNEPSQRVRGESKTKRWKRIA